MQIYYAPNTLPTCDPSGAVQSAICAIIVIQVEAIISLQSGPPSEGRVTAGSGRGVQAACHTVRTKNTGNNNNNNNNNNKIF